MRKIKSILYNIKCILYNVKHRNKRKKYSIDTAWFEEDKKEFIRQTQEKNVPFIISRDFPCLNENNEEGGTASGHYFHQDLLVAHEIYKANPVKHLDIGSRIDGFVAHVASFHEIEVMDIRNISSTLINISFLQSDLMNPIPEKYWNHCDSISSLHAIEHFGLGRYGDPIDAEGHLKGLDNIYKLLKPGGRFYFSVPIGHQRVEFNAHRIFSIKYLLEYLDPKYRLISFSFVDDNGDLNREVELSDDVIDNNCNCIYGCGIFILEKK